MKTYLQAGSIKVELYIATVCRPHGAKVFITYDAQAMFDQGIHCQQYLSQEQSDRPYIYEKCKGETDNLITFVLLPVMPDRSFVKHANTTYLDSLQ